MKWAQSSEKRWNANWRKSYKRCSLEELICWQLANLLTLSELAAKLSYVSCIHAEVAKYHRNFMQLFLSDATVIPAQINYKYLVSLKNDGCNNFRDWYVRPPVTMQHRRFLCLKCRSILKTATVRCIRSDILVENCRNALVLTDSRHSNWHHFRQFCWSSSKNYPRVSAR